MERMTLDGLVILAMLGFVGWLGGGRKWAFRTMLSALVLAGLGVAGVLLYGYWTDSIAEHRTQKIHDCAIAKVVEAQCVPGQRPPDLDALAAKYGGKPVRPGGAARDQDPYAAIAIPLTCPPYMLFDNPTAEQENAAIAAAEEECAAEVDPKQKSLHEQISQYKREHGIAPKGADWFSANAPREKLSPKACAAKIRKSYPRVYDDLDDATLTKKVLAKYPTYCDVTSSPPDFIPDLKGIR